MKKITVDGNTATATIAYALSDAATIYPITPSSPMAEVCDQWAGEGKKNNFGNTLKIVEMQSEGGASGALHGSLCGGALTTTFTASQGLLLMIPNMYKIAGELTPCVMHVSARALAYHALSIFGDHSDVMSVRQTGWAMLCSNSVQEAMDMALVAHLSTLKASVPFVHFFDGFRTSHEINTIEDIDMEQVKSIVPYDKIAEFKNRCLNSSNPHQQGTAQNPDIYFQNREACNKFYEATPTIVQETMNEVGKITGRNYHLFDYVGDPNAERVIVLMGSGAEIAELTVNHLNKTENAKLGVIKVRLYRPFDTKAFIEAIPSTCKSIAVLDRTKESGSDGEPLYKDVRCSLFDSKFKNITVVGGRFGLGSKEFTPSYCNTVFENLLEKEPKNHFTIGINDDVTNTSLKVSRQIHPSENVYECKFYGYGGDGTVSANKSSIKIIGNNTDLNGQAYFEYDSKKSGNATICHLRFGKSIIKESYLLDNIDFVSVHNQTYVKKYNILKNVKDNATLLLNTGWTIKEMENIFPNNFKRELALKNIKLYTIDAYKIAKELGLGNKINLVMQSAFFKLINILPYDLAVSEMKAFAKKSYGKFGEKVLEQNYKAIDSASSGLEQIEIPESWKDLKEDTIKTDSKELNKYYNEFIKPIESLDGDTLPVSAFDPRGIVPTGTTKFEKRGVAGELPCWESKNCIQCNMCAFVCPHACIRPHLVKKEDINNPPSSLQTLDATAEPMYKFVMQVSPKDCTGCGVCASVCPSKNKALEMKPASDMMETEEEKYNYISSLKSYKSNVFKPNSVKGSQFNTPYFEFSGACAGCGETPYIKVLSQLFGNRMVIANATGCSSIYGGSAPTCPYSKDENGNGIAWANSLFEDNAEFGLGIKLGLNINHEQLIERLETLKANSKNSKLNSKIDEYLNTNNVDNQRTLGKEILDEIEHDNSIDENVRKNIEILKDHFASNSVWIVGGDGWAYDIGYGGLDHVLASGENVNILVLNTEVYSNTGGQASKATPLGAVAKFASNGKRTNKKDLGLMATTYKDVYVAQVSMGANMNQFLTAITEAEAYNGVSLIIAYAPCINHGINMTNSQSEMKKAVDSGYWHLWRYNPTLKEMGKNPFILDSKEPTLDYEEFLLNESRYKSLKAKNPELAEKLFEEAKILAKERYEGYLKLSKDE